MRYIDFEVPIAGLLSLSLCVTECVRLYFIGFTFCVRGGALMYVSPNDKIIVGVQVMDR